MERRHFLQLIGSVALAEPTVRRPIVRTSRLYPEASPLKDRIAWMSEILALDDRILALHDNTILTATRPSGEVLWEQTVAPSLWGGLGVAGDGVLFTGPTGKILRLDPQSGEIKKLGSVGPIGGRIFYAGDGRFIRLQRFQIELWKADDTLTLEHSISADLPSYCRADLISDRLAVVTSGESDSILLVDTATGKSREYEVDFSSIRSSPSPILATGADRAKQLAYLALPVAGASVIVMVDGDGNVRRHGSCERDGLPVRVLKYGDELGIVGPKGSVAWYAD